MTREAAPRQEHDSRTHHVVTALEDHGLVDPARHVEAMDVVEQSLGGRSAQGTPMRRRLAELAGYVGGAFVVAAAALFLADQWPALSTLQRVGLLVAIAVLLLAAGVAVHVTAGGPGTFGAHRDDVRRRLASVLVTGGAASGAAAVAVWLDDAILARGAETGEGAWVGVGGGGTLVVLAVAGYLLAPSLLGQLAVALGAAYALPSALVIAGQDEPVAIGLGYLALGLVWLALTERGAWREPLPARVVGVLLVVAGAQIPLGSDQPWVAYLLTTLVAGAGLAVYVARRAWPYLALGVVGITLAVPEALMDWTEGSLGTAGVLLVAGVTLLVTALLGMRLHKEVASAA